MIRVMVVHPSPLANNATTQSLKRERDIRVIDHVFTIGEAQAKLSGDNCDVVVISASLPADGALELTHTLHRDYPTLRVIVVGVPEEQEVVLRYIGCGAAAYVPDSNSLGSLIATIRAVAKGEIRVPPGIMMAVIRRVANLSRLCRPARHNPAVYASLTQREQEIARLLAQGWSNQTIAEHLSVEVGTVKNHVHRILKKLNVRNRREAAGVHAALAGDELALLNPA
jgi:DNA-binding NarL/FixJ family response regulator